MRAGEIIGYEVLWSDSYNNTHVVRVTLPPAVDLIEIHSKQEE